MMIYVQTPDKEIHRLRNSQEQKVKKDLFKKYDPDTIVTVLSSKGKVIETLKLNDLFNEEETT